MIGVIRVSTLSSVEILLRNKGIQLLSLISFLYVKNRVRIRSYYLEKKNFFTTFQLNKVYLYNYFLAKAAVFFDEIIEECDPPKRKYKRMTEFKTSQKGILIQRKLTVTIVGIRVSSKNENTSNSSLGYKNIYRPPER
jgi:hypothetical protein